MPRSYTLDRQQTLPDDPRLIAAAGLLLPATLAGVGRSELKLLHRALSVIYEQHRQPRRCDRVEPVGRLGSGDGVEARVIGQLPQKGRESARPEDGLDAIRLGEAVVLCPTPQQARPIHLPHGQPRRGARDERLSVEEIEEARGRRR